MADSPSSVGEIMENQNRFNLESSLKNWRIALEHSPVLRGADIQELEDHLRDAIELLLAKGHAEEEAFEIATRRLGSHRELACEFGKMNSREIWLDRALWFLVGNLWLGWVSQIGVHVAEAALGLRLAQGASGRYLGFLYLIVCLGIQVGIALFCWRWVTRTPTAGNRFVRRCLRWPWLILLGLIAIQIFRLPILQKTCEIFASILSTILNIPPPMEFDRANLPRYFHLGYWGLAVYYIRSALEWLTFYYFLRSYIRIQTGASLASDKEDDQPASIPTLATTEKSADIQVVSETNSSPVEVASNSLRSLWIERGLWMIGGNLLIFLVISPLFSIIEYSLMMVSSANILNAYARSLVALAIHLYAIWFAAGYIWRKASNNNPTILRIGRIIMQRPATSMLLLFFLSRSQQMLMSWLFQLLSNLHLSSGYNQFWIYNSYNQIVYGIIPLFLIIWLACRRLQFQIWTPHQLGKITFHKWPGNTPC